MSIVRDNGEEEIVVELKRKLEVVGTEANAAKVEVKKLREEILKKNVSMKWMRHRIALLEEQVSVLQTYNESLRTTKEEIIGLPSMEVALTGRFYSRCTVDEEMVLKKIMEEVLRGDNFVTLKWTEQARLESISAVCSTKVLKSTLKGMMSDIASYRKRVIRDCFFFRLRYNKIDSNITAKTEAEKGEKTNQVKEARQKLMQLYPRSIDYNMG